MSRARVSRMVAGALAGALFLAVAVLPALEGPRGLQSGSASSNERGGRRAALLLLRELGWEARPWRQPPARLPEGRHLLWLPRAPAGAGDESERGRAAGGEARGSQEARRKGEAAPAPEDPLVLARRRGPWNPARYRDFVEGGGVLALSLDEGARDFLARDLGLELARGIELEPTPEGIPRARLADGTELEVRLSPFAIAVPAGAEIGEPLLSGGDGRPLALELPLGRGAVALLASDSFLRNEELGEADHALLFVRLVERLAKGEVLFDETPIGGGRTGSLFGLAFAPALRLFVMHVLLLAAVLVGRAAWPREFPRDPEPLELLSPLARARSQADLALRAGRPDVLAGLLRAGTLRSLERRLLGPAAAGREDEDPRARAEREVPRLAAAAGALDEADSWREALARRPVRTLAELAALDRDLRAIEARVAAGMRAAAGPGGAHRDRLRGRRASASTVAAGELESEKGRRA